MTSETSQSATQTPLMSQTQQDPTISQILGSLDVNSIIVGFGIAVICILIFLVIFPPSPQSSTPTPPLSQTPKNLTTFQPKLDVNSIIIGSVIAFLLILVFLFIFTRKYFRKHCCVCPDDPPRPLNTSQAPLASVINRDSNRYSPNFRDPPGRFAKMKNCFSKNCFGK